MLHYCYIVYTSIAGLTAAIFSFDWLQP